MVSLYISVFFRALFFLPGTVLHEFAHALVAIVFGRIHSFSLLPKIQEQKITFGSVNASARYKVLLLPIALAPLVWWVILFHLITSGLIPIDESLGLTTVAVFHLYICWQLLWAGKLSVQDLKVAAGALFSPSGLLFAFLSVIIFTATNFLEKIY